jgi:polysaccharide chain length determinant protein (PEP-CTERM system associated)
MIIIENQKVPEDYVKGVVTGTVEDRLLMIQQLLMSRMLLSQIIETVKPYKYDEQGVGIDPLLEKMRKSIKITTTKNQAFVLSFSHESPFIAQKVTATLADLLIKENLNKREQLVEGANEFLSTELTRAKRELEEREKAISEFKQANMGELPQQMEANLRALDRLQVEIYTQNEAMTGLTTRLAMIEKAMNEYEATGTPTTGVLAVPARKTGQRLSTLKELERKLASLSAMYKPGYPDIIQLEDEIAKLKETPQENEAPTDELSEPAGRTVGANPMDAYLRELARQQNEAKAEIIAVKDRLGRLRAQFKEYEGRVERTPSREQRLMVLVRDYENMQKNYQSLLDKKLNARIAENLEKRQKGEQFRIIDPANVPEKPDKPDTLLIMLAGLVIGCGVGFGMALQLDQTTKSFNYPKEIEQFLDLPLLASIPFFSTPSSRAGKVPALPMQDLQQSPSVGSTGLIPYRGNGELSRTEFLPELNLVAKWRPLSMVAEQYRVAATRLALINAERKNLVIAVTSSVKGEGKSSTAANLGYVLAKDLGKNTLVVDCDFKQSMLHTYFGAKLEPGLVDIFRKEETLDNCLQRIGDVPLWLLPAGPIREKPIELHTLTQLNLILDALRPRFDYIVLDGPPILPVADMTILASMSDFMVFVVRAGTTGKDLARNALESIKFNHQTGIILTHLQAEMTPYYLQPGYYGAIDEEQPA